MNPVSVWLTILSLSLANFGLLAQGFIKSTAPHFGASASVNIAQVQNHLPDSKDKQFIKTFDLPKDISADSLVLYSPVIGQYLINKDSGVQRPIASITKLMTALVFLEHNPGFETEIEILATDRREGGKIYVYTGEKIKIKDLFNLSLVASANTATVALVRSTGLSEEEFVRLMNFKAVELGLPQTKFADPIGFSWQNVSTAKEAVRLLDYCLSNPNISESLTLPKYSFTIGSKIRTAESTNELIESDGIFGKTGHTEAAGYCLVGSWQNGENRFISAVLGSYSNQERFSDTLAIKKILNE